MDSYFNICIEEALCGVKDGDIPIGAIIVHDNVVIAKAHNTREKDNNILGHAEINVILATSKTLNRWNLSDCDLYVTLEPCSMCKSVISQAKIKNVYYLLSKLDYKKEYYKTKYLKANAKNEQTYNCILSDFFKSKRK